MSSNILGIAWFDPADYGALRAVLKDGETALPPTHAAWLDEFKARELSEIVGGHEVCRVAVTRDEFLDWCDGLMQPTREACDLYATVQARRQHAAGAISGAPAAATRASAPAQPPVPREPAELVLAAHRAEMLPPVRPQRLETERNLARRP